MSLNTKKMLQREKEKLEWREKKYVEILAELQQDPALKEKFAGFDEESVLDFFKDYAREKVIYLEWGPIYVEDQEEADLKWVNDAFVRLEEIQQKKLFDLQCLWRAGQVDLPGIEFTSDFTNWSKDILNCPFLEPITTDEVALYRQYLSSANFDYYSVWSNWQDYDDLKKASRGDDDEGDFPEWYDFHNGRTGKGAYLSLPDYRGEKEEFYMELGRDEFMEQERAREKQQAPAKEPAKPWLNYHADNFITWFAQTFDSRETQKKLKLYGGEWKYEDVEYEPDEYAIDLSQHAEIWPIQASYDWREALLRSVTSYRIKKIADALPEAYEQYLMNLEFGIGFSKETVEEEHDLGDLLKKWIIRGKEIAGGS